jgi:hypothetical protein
MKLFGVSKNESEKRIRESHYKIAVKMLTLFPDQSLSFLEE